MKEYMPMRQAQAERKRGANFFDSLLVAERFAIGDALVLGEFDWRDWFDRRPSPAFMNGLDDARIVWESCGAR